MGTQSTWECGSAFDLKLTTMEEWTEETVGRFTFRIHPIDGWLTILTEGENLELDIFKPGPNNTNRWVVRYAEDSGNTYRDAFHPYLHTDRKVGRDGKDGNHCHLEFGNEDGVFSPEKFTEILEELKKIAIN